MLPLYCPYSIGNIPSGSELQLHLLTHFRISRAVQIFVLELSKDGLADLGDEFTDGGLANQPVLLQGGVGLSCCWVFSALFHFYGLPEIGDRLFDGVLYTFFDEVRKGRWHPDTVPRVPVQ